MSTTGSRPSTWVLLLALGASAQAGGQRPPPRPVAHGASVDAGTLATPFIWPTPDLLDDTDIPGISWARGVPVALHAVRVKHPLQEIFTLYEQAFARAGFYIPPARDQVQGLGITLTALDTRRKISYTAIFQPEKDHTTTIVLGKANLAERVDPDDEPGSLPLFPRAGPPLREHSEGGEVVAFEALGQPREVLAFYAQMLRREGFRPYPEDTSGGTWVNGSDEVDVSAEVRDGTRCNVVVSRRHRHELDQGPAAPHSH